MTEKASKLKELENNKAHTRKIEVSSYDVDSEHILLSGELTDDRMHDYYLVSGEKRTGGRLHHMVVRLLINKTTMVIEDCELEMKTVPREECHMLDNSLEVLKGMQIRKGFRRKVFDLLGGVRGCNHVVTLLLDMAPAAIQGMAAIFGQKPYKPLSTEEGRKNRRARMSRFLLNTCYVWREDGEAYQKLLRAMNELDQD